MTLLLLTILNLSYSIGGYLSLLSSIDYQGTYGSWYLILVLPATFISLVTGMIIGILAERFKEKDSKTAFYIFNIVLVALLLVSAILIWSWFTRPEVQNSPDSTMSNTYNKYQNRPVF